MPTFHVSITAEVEAESLSEAKKLAYKAMDDLVVEKTKFSIANDDQTIKDGRRIVFLHPPDTHSDYDPEIYSTDKNEK
jgi:hypothetical protein